MNRRLLTIIGSILCLFSVNASESFTYDIDGNPIKFEILSETTCGISSNNYASGKLNIPPTITYNGKEYSVTVIAADAFRREDNYNYILKTLTIPTTITEIGAGAFSGFDGISILFFNAENCESCGTANNPAFDGVGRLDIGYNVKSIPDYAFKNSGSGGSFDGSLTIPTSVDTIGASAFSGCSFNSVTIPTSVISIGEFAFDNCMNLNSITVEPGNRNYASADGVLFNRNSTELLQCPGGKKGSYTIPSYVTKIGIGAFRSCKGLTSVSIPSSVTGIGNGAFYGCSGLTSITIPASIHEISALTFAQCTRLTTVSIPNTVKSIGPSAFNGCTGLTSVILPDSITSISEGTFAVCTGLTSILIPDSVTSIDDRAFSNCTSLTSVNIPNSVTSIGASAFYGCTSLTSVTLPNSVTSIENSAFSWCTALTSVTIPNSVISIGTGTFSFSALTSITIPNSVTSIGESAFTYCEQLKNLCFEDGDSDLSIIPGVLYYSSGDIVKTDPFYENPLESIYIGRNLIYEEVESYETGLFYNKTNLAEVTIGDALTSIPPYTFYNCSALTSIRLGKSITSIGKSAFYGCNSLKSVNSPSINNWFNFEFEDEYANPVYYSHKLLINDEAIRKITVPTDIQRISPFAFINCESMVTVTFPESVSSIGLNAFKGCTGLQRAIFPSEESFLGLNYDDPYTRLTQNSGCKIYIDSEEYIYPENMMWPASINRIPNFAFYKVDTLKSIDIPQSVTEIGDMAFYYCTGLTSISLPNSLTSIAEDAFANCRRLKSVKIMDANEWSKINFGNISSNPINFSKTFSVGDSTEPVRNVDVNIGESEVSPFAFYNAQNLETIRVNAHSIGESAFQNCTNVKQICIDTDSISQNAFNNNSSVETIYCMRETAPSAPDDCFSKYAGVKLYVPYGSIGSYENAATCWCQFLDIYESDFSGLDDIFASDYSTGTKDILKDIEHSDALVEIYNLNGVKVSGNTQNLPKGIYILVSNGSARRIFVK